MDLVFFLVKIHNKIFGKVAKFGSGMVLHDLSIVKEDGFVKIDDN